MKLNTASEINDALQNLGYKAELTDEGSIVVAVGNPDNPFPVSVELVEDEVIINCDIASTKSAGEGFAIAALNANTAIRPYAFAILEDEGDEEADRIVLTDSLPLGDLSVEELGKSMTSLLASLRGIKPVLEVGLRN